ncbi:tol-pal system-associated acyl-CoA thioesterase [Lacimicrobium alkaliphilum]|uniref:Tol-pal system-associated acyl-CoA thioesterase n=1 Tax=Lacimicrobium alkaliphilum TaxID=1526571 RepID=A0ABQ1RRJ7_9ALTE|nr:tol-pal system-associated acyl-CoA thioesterase [Lacimicrobium alkaliphilum]GGD75789.1 tol-pal system-associated acyl-CoA thioesterase [Lacimicrobium alkaliphilum]
MHRHNIRVYYEDTDAGGIVYYANYLKFLERARTEWLRELGVEQDSLLEQSTGFVVKHLEIDYQSAARFNELLVVESQLASLKRTSLMFDQCIYNHNNRPLVKARVKVACVDLSAMRPMPIPDFVLGELSGVR